MRETTVYIIATFDITGDEPRLKDVAAYTEATPTTRFAREWRTEPLAVGRGSTFDSALRRALDNLEGAGAKWAVPHARRWLAAHMAQRAANVGTVLRGRMA